MIQWKQSLVKLSPGVSLSNNIRNPTDNERFSIYTMTHEKILVKIKKNIPYFIQKKSCPMRIIYVKQQKVCYSSAYGMLSLRPNQGDFVVSTASGELANVGFLDTPILCACMEWRLITDGLLRLSQLSMHPSRSIWKALTTRI